MFTGIITVACCRQRGPFVLVSSSSTLLDPISSLVICKGMAMYRGSSPIQSLFNNVSKGRHDAQFCYLSAISDSSLGQRTDSATKRLIDNLELHSKKSQSLGPKLIVDRSSYLEARHITDGAKIYVRS